MSIIDDNFTIQKCKSRREWLFARKYGIGASEAAQLVTINGMPVSNWGSPFSVYADKTTMDIEEETTERQLIWGTTLEPGIRTLIATRLRCDIGTFGDWAICWKNAVEDVERFQFATLDGWVENPNKWIDELCHEHGITEPLPHTPGVIELKSDARPPWEKPPLNYVCQVQHQLSVTGWKWGILGVFFSIDHSIRTYPIVRDDDLIRKINKAEWNFWRDHVQAKVIPPADGSDATRKALADYFDDPQDTVVDLPESLDSTIRMLVELKERQSQAKKEIAALENEIKAAMGNHTIGFTSSGSRVTWKPQTRKEHMVKESTFRRLIAKGGP